MRYHTRTRKTRLISLTVQSCCKGMKLKRSYKLSRPGILKRKLKPKLSTKTWSNHMLLLFRLLIISTILILTLGCTTQEPVGRVVVAPCQKLVLPKTLANLKKIPLDSQQKLLDFFGPAQSMPTNLPPK